ncbi:MAG TPA: hypothetical protein VFM68_02685 [Candidatus Saccharimonadales bacterium]|nr:hypothetical protein [Candidatus Saccharimonadales bacterium]
MAEPDWRAVLVTIGEALQQRRDHESKGANRIAEDIGDRIANNRNEDVSVSVVELHKKRAEIKGLSEGLNLIQGYLSGQYILRDK